MERQFPTIVEQPTTEIHVSCCGECPLCDKDYWACLHPNANFDQPYYLAPGTLPLECPMKSKVIKVLTVRLTGE